MTEERKEGEKKKKGNKEGGSSSKFEARCVGKRKEKGYI